MQIVDISTEQTTAATDVLLAAMAVICVIWVYRSGYHIDRKKTIIWGIAFIMLSFASILGSFAHGIKMPDTINKQIWQFLNLFLGLSVAFFAVGVVYDLQGFKIQKSILMLIGAISIAFYLTTFAFPGLFFVFVIYESIAMLFALISYCFLSLKRKLKGAFYMFAGILISIIAAIIQSIKSVHLYFIWIFDHNGLFHIFQIIGLFLICLGLAKEFNSRLQTQKF